MRLILCVLPRIFFLSMSVCHHFNHKTLPNSSGNLNKVQNPFICLLTQRFTILAGFSPLLAIDLIIRIPLLLCLNSSNNSVVDILLYLSKSVSQELKHVSFSTFSREVLNILSYDLEPYMFNHATFSDVI